MASDIALFRLSVPLADGLKLSSATSWNRFRVQSVADSDNTAANLSTINNLYRFKTLTQELRINYEGDRLSALLGAWYYRRTGGLTARSQINVPTPTGTITNLLTPYVGATSAATIATAYAQVLPVIPVAYAASQPERVETMALFGDARWRVPDRLTLIGGFGLDRERNRYAAETQATFTGTLPATDFLGTRYAPLVSAVNAGVLGLVDDANAPMAANTRTFHAFLPKAGVSMDWTPDLTTAFTVQRAYRSGGSSQNPARAGAVLLAYRGNRADQTWAVAGGGTLAPLSARWSDFLLHLHVNLHLPRSWGGFLVGLTGVALLSSLVSGVLAHPRVVRDAFHLRLGGSRRLAEADWHNRLGVWALPFHATLALTGALLGLSTLIVAALALLLYRGDRLRLDGQHRSPLAMPT